MTIADYRRYERVLLWVILVALIIWIAMLLVGQWRSGTRVPDVGETVIAAPSIEVAKADKKPVATKKQVRVYQGGAALKEGIKLPRHVVDDSAQEVLAATRIEADDHPRTVTTILNTNTGESDTYVRRDPLPWFSWKDDGGVGMYAGIKNGQPTMRLQARQELFAIKSVHFGALATVDQPMQGPLGADYFIGLGAEYRW